jgi:outer membrane autotransporter protein
LRLDGAIAHTWLDYDATAGTAEGDFDAGRWLFLTRLSGDHVAGRWTYTPSAEVFWLRETQDAYVDSLGTAQAKNSFTNGRANAGLEAAYAIPLSATTVLSPYAGIYADYYFGMEDDGTALSVVGIGDGWAARATGGLTLSGIEGWAVTLGAEAGNLGGEGPEFWTGRLGGFVNF